MYMMGACTRYINNSSNQRKTSSVNSVLIFTKESMC